MPTEDALHWFGRRDRGEPKETTAEASLAVAMENGMRAIIEVTATYAEKLFLCTANQHRR